MRYFISYIYYEARQPLFGNAEWEGDIIASLDQIKSIEAELRNSIQKKDNENVYVKLLFWQAFEGE